MNIPPLKAMIALCAGLGAVDLGMVGACASCQSPPSSPTTADAAAPTPPPAADAVLPSIATPTCRAACATMATYGCKLASASDCANTMTRIDLNPGASVGPNGKSPSCACVADAGSLNGILGCGIVCPP